VAFKSSRCRCGAQRERGAAGDGAASSGGLRMTGAAGNVFFFIGRCVICRPPASVYSGASSAACLAKTAPGFSFRKTIGLQAVNPEASPAYKSAAEDRPRPRNVNSFVCRAASKQRGRTLTIPSWGMSTSAESPR